MKHLNSQIRSDFIASIIVFFVALPLCLGIALASGAPLFSGIIAGIIGGIVVGALSSSALGVSGPAAGLATIVLAYIATLGSWESFLLVVFLAGCIQLVMGFLGLGTIAYYFPSSVIKGMLVGIGLMIIIKQVPHLVGYNFDLMEDFSSEEIATTPETISHLQHFYQFITPGAILISIVSIALLIFWEIVLSKKHKIFQTIPGPLAVVALGILFVELFEKNILPFALQQNHLVKLPASANLKEFVSHFSSPDFSQIANHQIHIMAITLAVIASLETLLSVEACDKIDPQKRVTPTNRELKAQGIGNIISGLIGGLPITQVIVRSSVNVTFGAKTKLSAILHGFILLLAVLSIPALLNKIPLSSLACILVIIGYKLAKPTTFKQMYYLGLEQFLPFIITILGILAMDLLKGISLGMAVALGYVIFQHFKNPYSRLKHKEGDNEYYFRLAENVSFINRGRILQMLSNVPDNAKLIIDGKRCKFIHHDVVEILKDFRIAAKAKNIELDLIEIDFRKHK